MSDTSDTIVLVVAGTRPELIKLAPVVHKLRQLGQSVMYLFTGQHGDPIMKSAGMAHPEWVQPHMTVDWVRTGKPEDDAAKGGKTIFQTWSAIRTDKPKCVVCQGDTASAMAGMFAALAFEVPLVHVEAGLRSFNMDQPEERIRTEIDRYADVLCCPSSLACAFAQRDAKPGALILPTGQTGNDAFDQMADHVRNNEIQLMEDEPSSKWGLITLHRASWTRESLGEMIKRIASQMIHLGLSPIWPIHPRWGTALEWKGEVGPCLVLEPFSYPTMVTNLTAGEGGAPAVVVTDSGGLVEECYQVGIPTVIIRQSTERWEPIAEGYSSLCPPTRDVEGHIAAALSCGELPPGQTYCPDNKTASHHVAKAIILT